MKICKLCGSAYDNLFCSSEFQNCPTCGLPDEKPIELKTPRTKMPTLNDCCWSFEELKDYIRNGNNTAEKGAVKF